MSYLDEATNLMSVYCEKEGMTGAFTATRSGNYICGVLPDGQHRDTFVAMTAIIHGGSETISMEMGIPLENVTVKLKDGAMLVMSLGSKAILAIIGKGIDLSKVDRAMSLAKELEKYVQ